jgi:hypothetical protein
MLATATIGTCARGNWHFRFGRSPRLARCCHFWPLVDKCDGSDLWCAEDVSSAATISAPRPIAARNAATSPPTARYNPRREASHHPGAGRNRAANLARRDGGLGAELLCSTGVDHDDSRMDDSIAKRTARDRSRRTADAGDCADVRLHAASRLAHRHKLARGVRRSPMVSPRPGLHGHWQHVARRNDDTLLRH